MTFIRLEMVGGSATTEISETIAYLFPPTTCSSSMETFANMAENIPTTFSAVPHSDGSNSPNQHPLSCTHCRQRKVKCNKVHPCFPCQRSGLDCVFPERARHPKKKKTGSKTTNEELLARLNRMEQLIGKMEGEGKPGNEDATNTSPSSVYRANNRSRANTHQSATHETDDSASPSDGLNRYIAGDFWRSLTSEVSYASATCQIVAPLTSSSSQRSRVSDKPLMMPLTEKINRLSLLIPTRTSTPLIPPTSLVQRSIPHETCDRCIHLQGTC